MSESQGRSETPDHDPEEVGGHFVCRACGRRWEVGTGPGMSCPGRVRMCDGRRHRYPSQPAEGEIVACECGEYEKTLRDGVSVTTFRAATDDASEVPQRCRCGGLGCVHCTEPWVRAPW